MIFLDQKITEQLKNLGIEVKIIGDDKIKLKGDREIVDFILPIVKEYKNIILQELSQQAKQSLEDLRDTKILFYLLKTLKDVAKITNTFTPPVTFTYYKHTYIKVEDLFQKVDQNQLDANEMYSHLLVIFYRYAFNFPNADWVQYVKENFIITSE